MKAKHVVAVALVAAWAPLAWAGTEGLQSQAAASSRAVSQSSGQAALAGQQGSAGIQSGTQISAELLTSLNAKKVKPGQKVEAKVTKDVKQNGRTTIRRGSRLIGHVVSAQASSKANAGSQMEVAFDRLVQGKTTTSLNAVVSSIVALPAAAPAAMDDMDQPMGGGPVMGGGSARGGLLGGAAGAVGSTVGAAGSAVGATAGSAVQATGQAGAGVARTAGGALGASANGNASANNSLGISNRLANIQVGSSAEGSSQAGANSLFRSRRGNLDLQSGTQLQLQVVGSAHAQAPAPKK